MTSLGLGQVGGTPELVDLRWRRKAGTSELLVCGIRIAVHAVDARDESMFRICSFQP
jgi:hypothetical protein